MSFPPNLGITSSLIIDSNSTTIFQEFPSLIPPLDKISSPLSRITKMNGYSRIKKTSTKARSKSMDFGDLSFPDHTPRSTTKITTMNEMIPEQEQEDGSGEVFGVILGRKCPISSGSSVQVVTADQENQSLFPSVVKRSFSIKRSASVSAGYSRIHHQSDLNAEDDDQCENGFTTQNRTVKKKGKFLKACRRLFGL